MHSLLRCIFACVAAVALATAGPAFAHDDDDDRIELGDDGDREDHDGDGDDDRSGPGSGDDDDDRSGSGSDDDNGAGSDGDDDNGGPGSGGDDDDDDDNGGPGSGGDDDDDEGDDDGLSLAAAAETHAAGAVDIDRDEFGREFIRNEALMLGERDDVERAVASGYTLISERALSSDGRVMARLLVPRRTPIDEAVRQLRALAPAASVSPNTIFRGAQTRTAPALRVLPPLGGGHGGLLGVIDTGAELGGLRERVVAARAFAAADYTPREHGSAVASIAAAHGARLQLADVFTEAYDSEPAASADAIVAALDWMVASGVAVINISIEGPSNAVLSAMLDGAAGRGHLIVAAAGNGGPMAAPAFPGAYDAAIAVTAVDRNNRAYARANRGEYIDFAAHGVGVDVNVGGAATSVSGTSFAAPVVAAQLAALHRQPSAQGARTALDLLRTQAVDLGRPGRDPIFGWGLVRPRWPAE